VDFHHTELYFVDLSGDSRILSNFCILTVDFPIVIGLFGAKISVKLTGRLFLADCLEFRVNSC
jgi:hypothetical protein